MEEELGSFGPFEGQHSQALLLPSSCRSPSSAIHFLITFLSFVSLFTLSSQNPPIQLTMTVAYQLTNQTAKFVVETSSSLDPVANATDVPQPYGLLYCPIPPPRLF